MLLGAIQPRASPQRPAHDRRAEPESLKLEIAFVPLDVTARATLKAEADGVATYEVVCENGAGEALLTGTASVRAA